MLEVDNHRHIHESAAAAPGLPASRDHWPVEAQLAYRRLMAELNSWCHAQGAPAGSNAWVAETAVREAWS